ncbi:MAG: hypothetical protein H0U44_05885 [Flavisolibacter sp.]|nr:hypothetical protein [Flavisolibacter sp.]
MRKLNLNFAIVFLFFALVTAGCKDSNKDATDTGAGDTNIETGERDTTAVLNDSNVSGTTSGTMEQVP